jgi:signal peptidase I
MDSSTGHAAESPSPAAVSRSSYERYEGPEPLAIVFEEGRVIKTALRDVLETALLTLVIFLGVRLGVQNFRVEGFSMQPTLQSNQYLLVNKVVYMVGEPQRGDIVVFRLPQDPRRDLIKRIVALPGEEVEVRNGAVYVNGKALDEPYIRDKPLYFFSKKTVPEGEYFVLGDNRNNSFDSHVWDFLPREYLIGKAWVSYWPVQSWSVVEHNSVSFAEATSG